MVPLDAGMVSIPCRLITCVEGTDYLCEESGAVSPQGTCIQHGDAAPTDACVPTCAVNACGVSDGCRGICRCPTGVTCLGFTCGNGCSGVPGDYCDPVRPDGGGPTTCCGAGYACHASDAGTNQCCSLTSEGPCGSDQDCCDYPLVHCNAIPTEAGVDAGTFLSHLCN